MRATCIGIKEGDEEVFINVKDLDLSPFKLGYFYDERIRKLLYIERIPKRNWRHGLTEGTISVKNGGRFGLPRRRDKRLAALFSPEYLSSKEAFLLAKKERREVAFHRQFSVDRWGFVRYKTQLVGDYEEGKVRLTPSFNWLKELVEKEL